ncbi:SLC13 family permease [Nocardia sp. BMG51109]|uniref:SLC13 family permease n=1 Tax=Nocardia sp. BMG51109 TaxID=1056816 RepID=UPI0004646EAD|nr:SLC13 family permease [Nocardia sp. BMG51109]
MWLVLGGLGLVAVVTGWLPGAEAVDIGVVRAGPILGFLVAVTVLAELADAAGVFDVAASVCARWGRGSTALLFVLVAALATVVTIGMSLDTTAVLLTPVVLALTTRLGLASLPFAVLVVWLANTASLLLPVSNLTNLLALQHGGMSTMDFARMMALPALVAVTITVGYLGILFRGSLTGGYEVPAVAPPPDRLRFSVCAAACVGFAVAVAAGVAPWLAATVAVVPALLTFAVRDCRSLRWSLFPWRLVVTTEGLFLAVGALTRHGLGDLLTDWVAGSGTRTVAVAAGLSNLVNNLPAYLAVESAVPAGASHQLSGALIGTNCGPLITMWGSLATLLWAERCRARGVVIRPLVFAGIGMVGVPLVLAGAWAATAA